MKELKIQYSREADAWDSWEQPYIFMRIEDKETYVALLEALSRQKPMKLKDFKSYELDGYSGRPVKVGNCPICGSHESNISGHCRKCGQKLDWSEEA